MKDTWRAISILVPCPDATYNNYINKCDYDPTEMKGKPIGMFHCPKCGEMIIAGLPHYPDQQLGEQSDLNTNK